MLCVHTINNRSAHAD